MANQNYAAIANPQARNQARMADYNKYAGKWRQYRQALANQMNAYNAAVQHLNALNNALVNAHAAHGAGSPQYLLAQANLNINALNIANIMGTHDDIQRKVQSNHNKMMLSLG